MASVWLSACLIVLVLAVSVSCETCPVARDEARENCPGLGCFVPVCDGDEFRAKQCRGSGCYCVDTNGERIGDYWFGYGEYSSSECECAREQLGNDDLTCRSDGDYLDASRK